MNTSAAILSNNSPLQRDIAADEIAQFRRDGIVCLRNVLAPAWIDTIRDGMEEQRQKPGPYATVIDNGQYYALIEQLSSKYNDKLHRAAVNCGAGLIAKTVAGAAQMRLVHDNIFYKDSGQVIETPWHQDVSAGYIDRGNAIRVWIPVDPVPRETTIEVVRGSHLWNVVYASADHSRYKEAASDGKTNQYYFNHAAEHYPTVPDIEARRESFDIVGYAVNPGDVVVFDYSLLHRGGPAENSSTQRRAFSVIYGDDNVTMTHRPNMVPSMLDVAGRTFTDGQSVGEFPEVFPAV